MKTGAEGWLGSKKHWLLLQRRTWVQFLAPTWLLTAVTNCHPRGPNALLWPLWALHLRGAQAHMQAKTPGTQNKSKFKNENGTGGARQR